LACSRCPGTAGGGPAAYQSAQVTNPQLTTTGVTVEKPAEGAHASQPVASIPVLRTLPNSMNCIGPITAGGFVKSGPLIFQDISEKAGVTRWTHKMGTPQKKYIIETNGSGVGLIDYDNDGWLDIYVVNGSTFDALDGKETPPHAALFHNNTMERLRRLRRKPA